MKKQWWVLVIIFLAMSAFSAGCSQRGASTSQTANGPQPIVSTLVDATLTAIYAIPPDSASLAAQNTVPATASPTSTRAPTEVPSPTVAPTATEVPSPTAAPAATETPAATLAPTPTPVSTVVDSVSASSAGLIPVTADGCIDKAGFFGDVSIPDNTLLQKNVPFVKTWRIRNVGTCTWGDGYQLVFANGHILDGPPTTPLPKAAPGDIIDISVNLKTPTDGGTYAGDWEFQNSSGKRFGVNSHGEDMIWVIIKVDWGPGVGPTPTPPPVNCAYTLNPAYEAQLLQLINSARAAKKLAPLTLSSKLTAAAEVHSADMACNSYLDHAGSDGSNYQSRIRAQGYAFTYATENIFGGGDAQGAFDWWMGSPIHHANIMDPKVTQIGIGYAFYSKSQYGGYFTLDFGHP